MALVKIDLGMWDPLFIKTPPFKFSTVQLSLTYHFWLGNIFVLRWLDLERILRVHSGLGIFGTKLLMQPSHRTWLTSVELLQWWSSSTNEGDISWASLLQSLIAPTISLQKRPVCFHVFRGSRWPLLLWILLRISNVSPTTSGPPEHQSLSVTSLASLSFFIERKKSREPGLRWFLWEFTCLS